MSLLENHSNADGDPFLTPGTAHPAGEESVSGPQRLKPATVDAPANQVDGDSALCCRVNANKSLEWDRERLELAMIDFVEELIRARLVAIYSSRNGRPHMRATVDHLRPLNHPLSDPLCAAWIAQLAYQRFRKVLPQLSAQRLCLILSGRASTIDSDSEEDAGALSAMNATPFVALMAAFFNANAQGTYEKQAKDLHQEIDTYANNYKPLLSKAVPANPSWLGRMLTAHKDLLRASGIVAERRESDGKHWRLSAVPDGTPQKPSGMESGNSAEKTRAQMLQDAIQKRKQQHINEHSSERSGETSVGNGSKESQT